MNSAASAGKLIADEANAAARIYAGNPNKLTYTSSHVSSNVFTNLFGVTEWPEG